MLIGKKDCKNNPLMQLSGNELTIIGILVFLVNLLLKGIDLLWKQYIQKDSNQKHESAVFHDDHNRLATAIEKLSDSLNYSQRQAEQINSQVNTLIQALIDDLNEHQKESRSRFDRIEDRLHEQTKELNSLVSTFAQSYAQTITAIKFRQDNEK